MGAATAAAGAMATAWALAAVMSAMAAAAAGTTGAAAATLATAAVDRGAKHQALSGRLLLCSHSQSQCWWLLEIQSMDICGRHVSQMAHAGVCKCAWDVQQLPELLGLL